MSDMILRLELLSDALPGGGASTSTGADRDIALDANGLPWIPARRVKGLLKLAGRDLVDAGKISNQELVSVFGDDGGHEGSLRLSNGCLDGHATIARFVRKTSSTPSLAKVFPLERVVDEFTTIRAQTAIAFDEGTPGVAKRGSLRTSRVLRRGTAFTFTVDLPREHASVLETCCKVARHAGSSWTRGLGEVRFTLHDESGTKTSPGSKSVVQHGTTGSLCLRVEPLEPLVVTGAVQDGNVTETFLRGSQVRGALARSLMDHPRFKQVFLSPGLLFSNCYPIRGERQYLPVPASIVVEKHSRTLHDLASMDAVEADTSDLQVKNLTGFVNVEGRAIETLSIDTAIEFHHRRSSDRAVGHVESKQSSPYDDTGNFFHYEAILPRTTLAFAGLVEGEPGLLDVISTTVGNGIALSFGKSKGVQYGTCKVTIDPGLAPRRAVRTDHPINGANRLVATFLSDTIVKNDKGFPTCNKDDLLAAFRSSAGLDDAGIATSVAAAFIKNTAVGGFSDAWGLPKLQHVAVARGSVLVIDVKRVDGNGVPNVNVPRRLFVGERCQEGFGECVVNWHGNDDVMLVNLPDVGAPEEAFKDPRVKVLATRLLIDAITENLLPTARKHGNGAKSVSRTFIHRLERVIERAGSHEDIQESIKDFKDEAKEKFNKLCDALYYEKFSINKKKPGFLKNEFSSLVNGARPDARDPTVRDFVTRTCGITEDYAHGEEFTLYKTYALAVLRHARLAQKAGGGKNP